MFSKFSITQNKETAKYLPYNELSYPKLDSHKQGLKNKLKPSQSLGSQRDDRQERYMKDVWMSAFLDHELQTEKERTLKELSTFIALPEGQLLPEVSTYVRKANKRFAKIERKLQLRRKKIHKQQAPPEEPFYRPGPNAIVVPTISALRKRFANVRDSSRTNKTASSSLGLGKKGKKKKKKVAVDLKKALKKSMSIYAAENRKLRRVLREKRPRNKQTAAASGSLDDLFELERRLTVASMVIQGAWKRYQAKLFWQTYMIKVRSAIVIQKIVRGAVTREFVRRWYKRRRFLIVISQSIFRGVSQRRIVSIQREGEVNAVITLQRIVRGHIHRRRAWRALCYRSSTRISKVWRGVVGRAYADKLWLDREIIKIQSLVRGHLGRVHEHAENISRNSAAKNIQRTFRGRVSRRERDELIWSRESTHRRWFLNKLRSEEEYQAEDLKRMKRRIQKKDLTAKIRALREVIKDENAAVYEAERSYVGYKREQSMADREANRRGWPDELKKLIDKNRISITNLKISHLFGNLQTLRKYEERRSFLEEKVKDKERYVVRVKEWRAHELQSMFRRESEKKWEKAKVDKKRAVAEQRRKWKVRFYTKEGKPDKKRRIGHPVDPSVYAGPEAEQFFLGNAHIFQTRKHYGDGSSRIGSKESLNELQNMIHLQSVMNQTLQYGALLKPLMSNMVGVDVKLHTAGFPQNRSSSAPGKPETAGGDQTTDVKTNDDKQPSMVAGYDVSNTNDDQIISPRLMEAFVPPPTIRRKKKKKKKYTSKIPWTLLDELEAEKFELQQDRKKADDFFRNRFRRDLSESGTIS